MLIEFEFGNFRSFRDVVRMSMSAAKPFKEYQKDNVIPAERYSLLKSAAVYGANASGKSNLILALGFMRWFVLSSSKDMQKGEEIEVTPFLFNAATENAPSHFQIIFLFDGIRYRYGFDVDRTRVHREWLFQAKKVKESPLFLRENDEIEVMDDFAEGRGLEQKTRDNALFLSVASQFNGWISGKILGWFENLIGLHGLMDAEYERYSAMILKDERKRAALMEFLRRADLGIEDIQVTEESVDPDLFRQKPDEFSPRMPKSLLKIQSMHSKFHEGRKMGVVPLDFNDESDGTVKFFHMAGPILDCLQNGYVTLIDELDSRLHPALSRAIVKLFNSSTTNPKNAQLIFCTHDTNLLSYGQFRRDQIWFTEKDREGSSDLYSLAEIKIRKDASYEKDYIQGKYGAVPYLGDFSKILQREAHHGETC